jgi:transcriptional regulator with XRE-family HTH domain
MGSVFWNPCEGSRAWRRTGSEDGTRGTRDQIVRKTKASPVRLLQSPSFQGDQCGARADESVPQGPQPPHVYSGAMIMARGPRSQSGGLQALYDRYIGDDPAKVDAFEAARSNAEVARCIYRLRAKAGLTQRDLAALVGTSPSVICRLEDADYDGHSLSLDVIGNKVFRRFPAVFQRFFERKTLFPITSNAQANRRGAGTRRPDPVHTDRRAGAARRRPNNLNRIIRKM